MLRILVYIHGYQTRAHTTHVPYKIASLTVEVSVIHVHYDELNDSIAQHDQTRARLTLFEIISFLFFCFSRGFVTLRHPSLTHCPVPRKKVVAACEDFFSYAKPKHFRIHHQLP